MNALRRRLAARAARREISRRTRPGPPESLPYALYMVPALLLISSGGAIAVVLALRWWLGA